MQTAPVQNVKLSPKSLNSVVTKGCKCKKHCFHFFPMNSITAARHGIFTMPKSQYHQVLYTALIDKYDKDTDKFTFYIKDRLGECTLHNKPS